MKPMKLRMKAFGPYVDESVDFEAMGNSLYLITGDTGAGKSTIFDAITFALYGTVSSKGKSELSATALHSDYTPDRSEMLVELTFMQKEQVYTVSRRLYWGKRGKARMFPVNPISEAPTVWIYPTTKKASETILFR